MEIRNKVVEDECARMCCNQDACKENLSNVSLKTKKTKQKKQCHIEMEEDLRMLFCNLSPTVANIISPLHLPQKQLPQFDLKRLK